jgi:hypothetical protein
LEVVVETPVYDLTIFKLHFGKLTLKVYTKGERVLRFEAIVHNTKELRCGRLLERFPQIIARLQQILEQFLNNLYCMDASFISGETLDQLATPSQVGKTRVGGMDVNKPRTRAVLELLSLTDNTSNDFTVRKAASAECVHVLRVEKQRAIKILARTPEQVAAELWKSTFQCSTPTHSALFIVNSVLRR